MQPLEICCTIYFVVLMVLKVEESAFEARRQGVRGLTVVMREEDGEILKLERVTFGMRVGLSADLAQRPAEHGTLREIRVGLV